MEPSWSSAVATHGNRWQMGRPQARLKQAKTVATGCDQLPIGADGKEGVDGSSPSEGSRKGQQMAFFVASNGTRRDAGLENLSPRSVPRFASGAKSWLEQTDGSARSTSLAWRYPDKRGVLGGEFESAARAPLRRSRTQISGRSKSGVTSCGATIVRLRCPVSLRTVRRWPRGRRRCFCPRGLRGRSFAGSLLRG
jgi:hypothetical protein